MEPPELNKHAVVLTFPISYQLKELQAQEAVLLTSTFFFFFLTVVSIISSTGFSLVIGLSFFLLGGFVSGFKDLLLAMSKYSPANTNVHAITEQI